MSKETVRVYIFFVIGKNYNWQVVFHIRQVGIKVLLFLCNQVGIKTYGKEVQKYDETNANVYVLRIIRAITNINKNLNKTNEK